MWESDHEPELITGLKRQLLSPGLASSRGTTPRLKPDDLPYLRGGSSGLGWGQQAFCTSRTPTPAQWARQHAAQHALARSVTPGAGGGRRNSGQGLYGGSFSAREATGLRAASAADFCLASPGPSIPGAAVAFDRQLASTIGVGALAGFGTLGSNTPAALDAHAAMAAIDALDNECSSINAATPPSKERRVDSVPEEAAPTSGRPQSRASAKSHGSSASDAQRMACGPAGGVRRSLESPVPGGTGPTPSRPTSPGSRPGSRHRRYVAVDQLQGGGYEEMFCRPRPVQHEADALRPAQTVALPPSPPSPDPEELIVRARPRKPLQARSLRPFGGVARGPRVPAERPSRMAPPSVNPHNSWCTFVEWMEPSDGGEGQPGFTYELNCKSVSTGKLLHLEDLGQDPWAQVSGLDAGDTYCFQVRAKNIIGPGDWSHWSVPYEVPRPMLTNVCGGSSGSSMHPRTSSQHPTSAVLQWEEPCSHGAQVVGYRVQYGTDPNDPDTHKSVTVINRRTSLEVYDLTPNHLYYFRVCAINEVGDSQWTSWSDAIATRATESHPPSPPLLDHARPQELFLKWASPATCGFPVLRWELRYAKEDRSMCNAVDLPEAASVGGAMNLRVRGLRPNTAYYFQLRVETAMGMSHWSEPSEPLRTLGQPPLAPDERLKVVDNRVGSLILQWEVPEHFQLPLVAFVLRWFSGIKHNNVITEVGRLEVPAKAGASMGETIQYKVPGVHPGDKLFFQVAARSSAGLGGFSPQSQEILVCPDVPVQPEPPTVELRTAISLLVVVEDNVKDNGSRVLHYDVRYDKNKSMQRPYVCQGHMVEAGVSKNGLRLFEYPLTRLRDRGPYYISVRAVNSAGASNWSPPSEGSFIHQSAPARMAAPTLHRADSINSVLLAYSHAGDLGQIHGGHVLEYEIRYSRWPQLLRSSEAGWNFADTKFDARNNAHEMLIKEEAVKKSHIDVFSHRWRTPPHDGKPPPSLRIPDMLTGRDYFFQIRALSSMGAGEWSDLSRPFQTQPSVPDKPPPVTRVNGPGHAYMADIRLTLPECNGQPVEISKLRIWGPNWNDRPIDDEWRDLLPVVESACEVRADQRVPPVLESATPNHVLVWEYSVLHLEPGAYYRFVLCCANSVGWSPWSDPSEPIVTSPTIPCKCDPVVIAEGGCMPFSLRIEWPVPHDGGCSIVDYTLEWSTNDRFEGVKTQICLEAGTLIENLYPNQEYYFRACARNAQGPGQFSNCSRKTGDGCLRTAATVPGPVRDLSVKAVPEEGGVHITWNKPAIDGGFIVSKYKIRYAQREDFTDVIEVVQKTMREIKLLELDPERLYWFDVCAANALGFGDVTGKPVSVVSPILSFQRILPNRPQPPLLQLQQQTWSRALEAKVSWKCPEDYHRVQGFIYTRGKQTHPITHYTIRFLPCEPDPDFPDNPQIQENHRQLRDRRTVPKDSTNNTRFQRLLPGRRYWADVMSHSEAGDSPWSDKSEVIQAPPWKPQPATTLKCIDRTDSTLVMEWNSPRDNGSMVDRFYIRCEEEKSFNRVLAMVPKRSGSPLDGSDEEDKTHDEDDPGTMLIWDEALVEEMELPASVRGGLFRWTITGLRFARMHVVQVRAGNTIGCGRWATASSLRTSSIPPAAPGVSEGIPEEATISGVTFTWGWPAHTGGETLEGFEVVWITHPYLAEVPTDEAEILNHPKLQRVRLGETVTIHHAEGVNPGDAVLPLVRCWNCMGYSAWSRIPSAASEVAKLSALPTEPSPVTVPPVLERSDSENHRPFGLTLKWVVPDWRGRVISRFDIRLTPVEQATDEPIHPFTSNDVSEAEVYEVSYEHPGGSPWPIGSTLELRGIHADIVPGVAYVPEIRGVNEVGVAEWGVPGLAKLAPPDLPSKPDVPTSQWQWPNAIEVLWNRPPMQGAQIEQLEMRYSTRPNMEPCEMVSEEELKKKLLGSEVFVGNLKVATFYHFQLRVRNGVGWSPWSPVSRAYETGVRRPAAPDMPKLLNITTDSMHIQWNRPNDHGAAIEQYDVILADAERSEEITELLLRINAMDEDDMTGRDRLLDTLPPKARARMKAACLSEPTSRTTSKSSASTFTAAGNRAMRKLKRAAKKQRGIQAQLAALGYETQAEAFDADLFEHVFDELLGGIYYSCAVRAYNCIGWSDWSVPLTPVMSPSAEPVQCPPPVLVEATATSLLVEWRLPYGNGEPVTHMELHWKRVVGPVERHLALGGALAKERPKALEGDVPCSLPSPPPEPARPEGLGGAGQNTIYGLEAGTEYDVQVRAANEHGFGLHSIPVRMVCAPGRPDAPGRLRHGNPAGSLVASHGEEALPVPTGASPRIVHVRMALGDDVGHGGDGRGSRAAPLVHFPDSLGN